MKKQTIIIVVLIIIAIGAFLGGWQYGKSGSKNKFSVNGQFPNGMASRNGTANGRVVGSSNNSILGEIISQDDKSVTLKINNGSSKIIFFSASTTVMKLATSTLADLKTGATLMVAGVANSDGSVTAKTIQIRPEISNQPGFEPVMDK